MYTHVYMCVYIHIYIYIHKCIGLPSVRKSSGPRRARAGLGARVEPALRSLRTPRVASFHKIVVHKLLKPFAATPRRCTSEFSKDFPGAPPLEDSGDTDCYSYSQLIFRECAYYVLKLQTCYKVNPGQSVNVRIHIYIYIHIHIHMYRSI